MARSYRMAHCGDFSHFDGEVTIAQSTRSAASTLIMLPTK
jgi:hypothetical protein